MRMTIAPLLLLPYPLAAQSISWWHDLNDMAFGQTAAADVDGDGQLELAFSTYRNDSSIHVLNAEDGSLLWSYNTGGCNDVAPLIHDVDQDGDLEIVLPGSCNPITFCFDADSGYVAWATPTDGSDSPPTIGELDADGKLEILHGQFGGRVLCINAEDGSVAWEIPVDLNSWIQTEPALLDADNDGQLDFIVANWNFADDHRIWCFRGSDQNLLWQDTLPDDVMYHGAAFGDIDNDGLYEITIGDYAGNLFCYNAEDGSLNWDFSLPSPGYIGAPTSLADLNNDGELDVVFSDWYRMAAVTGSGSLMWSYSMPGYASSFRGAVIGDVNGDNTLDVTFGTSEGLVISLDGLSGTFIRSIDLAAHYGDDFEIDHAPILADLDNNGVLDVFVVGGHAEYPDVQNNYGRAYAIEWGVGNGPEWTMFRRDVRRSACVCDPISGTGPPPAERHPRATILPNPMTDHAWLHVAFDHGSGIEAHFMDMRGRTLARLIPCAPGGGTCDVLLDRRSLGDPGPGVYLMRISAGPEEVVLRVLIE